MENEIDGCALCKNAAFMRLFRSAYCANRHEVHTGALSEGDVVHKVLDGGHSVRFCTGQPGYVLA